MTSALRTAFEQARQQRNIDLILPVLREATLYVVVAPHPTQQGKEVFFVTRSPNKERFAVTVSESLDTLATIQWPKRKMTGEQLLAELTSGLEIVVVYPDGGDYITREHLEWYRQLG